ncbi:MAG TPA: FKBP-type peptidyl-prolyl cis-trans isomerase [Steroidobacteraceae bacterium]|nr:FKBP-type peptidyl-prolyl cis-trans isomerase [Steroidobacteraceae bacterium]
MRRSAVLLICGLMAACHGKPPAATAAGAAAALEIHDLRIGTGATVAVGETAVVDYTGWLYDPGAADDKGKEFDSSRGNATPLRFKLGAGRVIKGWDVGLQGMKVGGRRRLVIPPQFAYGERGAGGVIPPDATLVFDIDLIAIE